RIRAVPVAVLPVRRLSAAQPAQRPVRDGAGGDRRVLPQLLHRRARPDLGQGVFRIRVGRYPALCRIRAVQLFRRRPREVAEQRAVLQLAAARRLSAERAGGRAGAGAGGLAPRAAPAGGGAARPAADVPLPPGRRAMTAAGLRVALIDPSFFTIPYDARLAGALGALGHEVVVYGEARAPAELPTEFARLRPLFYPELLRFASRRWTRSAVRLVRELRDTAPDIVHFQWAPLPALDRLFLGRLRQVAPVVLTAHDSQPLNGTPSPLQTLGAIGILREFDGVIVHTEAARERLIAYGVRPGRVVRIAHGPLHEPPQGAAPREPAAAGKVRFLLFGKLKDYKGADVLIEAYRRLPREVQAS